MRNSPDKLEIAVQTILSSRKYAGSGVLPDTVRDVLRQEFARHSSSSAALDSARRKLHNIIAPYLGDPDYRHAQADMETAFSAGEQSRLAFCRAMLASHDSSRERLPILVELYQQVFAITGQPQVMTDLACGLNPFALPWMGLTRLHAYHAYDIIQPRVDLINQFFALSALPTTAQCRDILVQPPDIHSDVTLLFKEAHRIQQRRPDANRALLRALNTNWLVVSLPPASLRRGHDLSAGMRRLVERTLEGTSWPVRELVFETELVFVVEKTHD